MKKLSKGLFLLGYMLLQSLIGNYLSCFSAFASSDFFDDGDEKSSVISMSEIYSVNPDLRKEFVLKCSRLSVGDKDCEDPRHPIMWVKDLEAAVDYCGEYVDCDDFIINRPCYTGEMTDCIGLVIRYGTKYLLSHVQGLGDSRWLSKGIGEVITSRVQDESNVRMYWYTDTGTEESLFSTKKGSADVLLSALIDVVGKDEAMEWARRCTIITGYKDLDIRSYAVVYVNSDEEGALVEIDAEKEAYEGLKHRYILAPQF